MKRFIALFLSLSLILSSAACTKNNDPTGGAFGTTEAPVSTQATAEPTTAEPTTAEPTTAEPVIDKQAFYEELFAKGNLQFAGESMKTSYGEGESGISIRYESAGNDNVMLMQNTSTGYGFGVFAIGEKHYLYGKLKSQSEGIMEHLYEIKDPEFSMGDEEKPEMDFEPGEQEYSVEYLSTSGGLDEVRLTLPEEDGVMDLFFNEDVKVTRVSVESDDGGQPVDLEYYTVDRIELPEGISPEEASDEEFAMFAMACLFGMAGNIGDVEDPFEFETEPEESETESASVSPLDDMFLAELDLQIDYEGDSGTYTFRKLPKTSFDMMMLIDSCGLWTPYETAAFFIVALHTYQSDPATADQMIRQLMAPDTTDAGCKFIEGQLKEKPYLCDIYFRGVDMKTKKTPEAPYVIHVSKTTGTDAGYTYVKVWTDAIGGDRTIVLKQIGQDYYVVKCPALLLSLGDQPY
ncbi:MAG: hypothetical protein IKI54_01065 [Lachnospiraceae bacterium]|nr:hypothetical protein [Lachnospiraceae bacterium]